MNPLDQFSNDYAEARGKFLAACRAAGLAPEHHVHPKQGPGGEELAIDVAWLGPRDAKNVMVTLSATHGIEGFVGSAAQTAWLSQAVTSDLPLGAAHLLVHGLNPHGFAHLRRVDENNVDLNRNFVDHGRPPANPGYAELADAIAPPSLDEAVLAEGQARLEAYRERHGFGPWVRAVIGGQYEFADGLFYGGCAPSWSHRRLVEILRTHLKAARQVGVIDVHTGLGPYGHGQIMGCHPTGSPGHALLTAWFGEEAAAEEGHAAYDLTQPTDTSQAFAWLLGTAELVAICLEFGTRPEMQVLHALRRDNWLYLHGDPTSEQGREIKAEIRDAFYPDDPAWRQAVLTRALEVHQRMLTGLAADS